jgi:hypothetical protein
MDKRTVVGMDLPADDGRQARARPRADRHLGEAQLPRSPSGRLAHGEKRQFDSPLPFGMGAQRAQRVPAGDDGRLRTLKVQRNVLQELDLKQGGTHRFVAKRRQRVGFAGRVGFWPRYK